MSHEIMCNKDYYSNGDIKKVVYFKGNHIHRTDGPARIEFFENGNIKSESYWINGQIHRINMPAWIEYCENKNIAKEEYYINGLRYRVNGPSLIEYDYFGGITTKIYTNKFGEFHREDGPAMIFYDKGSKKEEYYINSQDLTKMYCRCCCDINKDKILKTKSLNKLLLYKIICIQKSYSELLDLIDSRLLLQKLTK